MKRRQNREDQWDQKLILWKDQQSWLIFSLGLRRKSTEIRNESGDSTTNSTEIKILREYYEQLYNLDEMDKFLETQNLPRLSQKK